MKSSTAGERDDVRSEQAWPEERFWVLYVEDNEDDVRLVREFLPRSRFPVAWAPDAATAKERLATEHFDLILLDHGLPDTNSLRFLQDLRERLPELPVVILTGREDVALESSALRQGAVRYLLKDRIAGELVEVIEETVRGGNAARAENRAGGLLSRYYRDASERLYAALLETMNEGCLLVDIFGIVTYANGAASRMLETVPGELLGRHVPELFDEATGRRLMAFHWEVLNRSGPPDLSFEGRLRKGAGNGSDGRTVLISGNTIHNELGKYEAVLLVLTDISELAEARRALQSRLSEMERFQRFFLDRENTFIQIKAKLRDYEKRLGLPSPGLSDETRRELEKRLKAREKPS